MTLHKLSFLYCARTILRSSGTFAPSFRHFLRPRTLMKAPVFSQHTSSAPSQGFFQQKANESEVALEDRPAKSSTITGQEKKVFNKIFEELTKSDAEHEGAEVVSRKDNLEVDHERILALFSNTMRGHYAEQKETSSGKTRGAGQEHTSTLETDYISRYPKELRQAARRASKATLRVQPDTTDARTQKSGKEAGRNRKVSFKPMSRSQEPDRDISTSHKSTSEFMRPNFLDELSDIGRAEVESHEAFVRLPFVNSVAVNEDLESGTLPDAKDEFDHIVDTVAQREMSKIAQSFDASIAEACRQRKAMDLAIWNVCELLVFPMLNDLDTRGHSMLQPSPQEGVTTQKTMNPEINNLKPNLLAQDGRTSSSIWRLDRLPAYIPPLSIVSRLYPAALLLAMRLYAKHCPTSPFALALLPQIRSEGVRNYVLGGTTPFYNTLIQLQWDVYSNLREINRLLTEMEKSGIELDGETHDILVSIGEERWADVNRHEDEKVPNGARSKDWWERPQQVKWFDKVCVGWRQVIAARLQERGEALSGREYGLARGMMVPSSQGERHGPVMIG